MFSVGLCPFRTKVRGIITVFIFLGEDTLTQRFTQLKTKQNVVFSGIETAATYMEICAAGQVIVNLASLLDSISVVKTLI